MWSVPCTKDRASYVLLPPSLPALSNCPAEVDNSVQLPGPAWRRHRASSVPILGPLEDLHTDRILSRPWGPSFHTLSTSGETGLQFLMVWAASDHNERRAHCGCFQIRTCQGLPGRSRLLLEPWHAALFGDKGEPDILRVVFSCVTEALRY